MTSSLLTGEKRWASARRGGMTVLGKVAVPKPINLPSQRLENHGLDPNVEIVPKGTHSWGSRSSSSSSNPWGSASVSPNADGGTGSPSHLSARPSSGGTGTRPSTAGSERAHDPISNVWGSSSRPSSSSGSLPSNQTSHAPLRPRSAETRPGSSQLSRFAEPLSDNSAAWGGTGTTEKLGVTSSKNDGFSLTSRDFPTLGSEKDNLGKNQDYVSHGHPGSTAGMTPGNEGTGNSAGDGSLNVNEKFRASDSWRKESPMYGEDGARSNVEKWHADPQPFPNSSIPPQHYDTWHGPPVNNHAGGVWYRGPPGGPPFGSPVAPGGFPMEPFPYYRPQMPPLALANPQPVPPPGAGPRGPHPKNGDMYRPRMHDAYVRPSMPLRPGFYPGPVPYDGYYGPPVSYCSSNERDAPYMGMPMGPAAYNRYPGQNIPDLGNSHGRTSGYGPSSMAVVSDQVETVHPRDPRVPYQVLMKQQDGWEGKDEEQKCDDSMKSSVPYSLKGEHPGNTTWENEWRAVNRKDDEMDRAVGGQGASCEAVDSRATHLKMKSPEHLGCTKADAESISKKFGHTASTSAEVSAPPKDSSLIQKIEGLNAKARASDERQNAKFVYNREKQKNKSQGSNAMASQCSNEAGSAPNEDHYVAVDGTDISRRSIHGVHDRSGHYSGGIVNVPEADGRRKKSQVIDPQNVTSTVQNGVASVSYVPYHGSAEVDQNCMPQPQVKDIVESIPPFLDSSDSQRAKLKELAKRLKQREKEEEERTREQRAKALAKLEELNKRTQAGEGASQKLEDVPATTLQTRKDESLNLVQPAIVARKSEAPSSSLSLTPNAITQSRNGKPTATVAAAAAAAAAETVFAGKSQASNSALDSSPDLVSQISESSVNRVEKATTMVNNSPRETPKAAQNDSIVVQEQVKSFHQGGNKVDTAQNSSTPRFHDATKHKRTSYKQTQNAMEKSATEKPSSPVATEASKDHTDTATDATTYSERVVDAYISNNESSLSANMSMAAESYHKRKNRNGKNKHKVEEASCGTRSLPALSKETSTLDTSLKKQQPSETVLDLSLGGSQTDLNDVNQSSEPSLLTNEETRNRVNHQWKSNHPRRMVRNIQGNKLAEKTHGGDAVVWAPVRVQNKTEVSDEADQNTVSETVSSKGDQQVQNNPRNKRAEIERYTPKAVAKELSHQAVVPANCQVKSDEIVEKTGYVGTESNHVHGTASGTVDPAMESRNEDVRQSKSGRVHGSWRQRGVAEVTTNPRSSQKSVEDQHQKSDVPSTKEQPSHPDEWNDGWSMPENPDAAVNVPILKDPGAATKGKRQPHKGHKATGYHYNTDEKKSGGGDTEKVYVQPSAFGTHPVDLSAALKENHDVGEHTSSHWQRKSRSLSATNQRGSRPDSSVNVDSEGGSGNREFEGGGLLPQPDNEMSKVHSYHDRSSSQKRNLNNRFGKEHDSRRDWNGSGKDKQQNNPPAIRERQRHNSHYEYHPVGSHNNNKTSNFETPKEGSHNSGGRHREKSQARRGGGNFHGRRTGNVQVDAGYE